MTVNRPQNGQVFESLAVITLRSQYPLCLLLGSSHSLPSILRGVIRQNGSGPHEYLCSQRLINVVQSNCPRLIARVGLRFGDRFNCRPASSSTDGALGNYSAGSSKRSRSPVGAKDACVYASPGIAFRHHGRCRHSDFLTYRGSIPRLHVLLSTLHFQPCDCKRMTRSRCGSLARPSPYGSFIHTSTPVYPGAPMITSSNSLFRERDAPSCARCYTSRHVRYRAVPRTNRTLTTANTHNHSSTFIRGSEAVCCR
jgi:hypothetical protein